MTWARDTGTRLRQVQGDADFREAMALRFEVFCEEQGVPRELEADEADDKALHLIAERGGTVVGVCRVVLDGTQAKIGRMAVSLTERGGRVGVQLLRYAEAEASRRGAATFVLDAQLRVAGFYAANGYVRRGDEFDDAGIPHVRMTKWAVPG